jgi:hypothetical protein
MVDLTTRKAKKAQQRPKEMLSAHNFKSSVRKRSVWLCWHTRATLSTHTDGPVRSGGPSEFGVALLVHMRITVIHGVKDLPVV